MALQSLLIDSLSVEDCVYHMQLQELLGEADIEDANDERTDSTARLSIEALMALSVGQRHWERKAEYRRNKLLNGPGMAKKNRSNGEWQKRNPEQHKSAQARYIAKDPEAYRKYAREYQRARKLRLAASRRDES